MDRTIAGLICGTVAVVGFVQWCSSFNEAVRVWQVIVSELFSSMRSRWRWDVCPVSLGRLPCAGVRVLALWRLLTSRFGKWSRSVLYLSCCSPLLLVFVCDVGAVLPVASGSIWLTLAYADVGTKAWTIVGWRLCDEHRPVGVCASPRFSCRHSYCAILRSAMALSRVSIAFVGRVVVNT